MLQKGLQLLLILHLSKSNRHHRRCHRSGMNAFGNSENASWPKNGAGARPSGRLILLAKTQPQYHHVCHVACRCTAPTTHMSHRRMTSRLLPPGDLGDVPSFPTGASQRVVQSPRSQTPNRLQCPGTCRGAHHHQMLLPTRHLDVRHPAQHLVQIDAPAGHNMHPGNEVASPQLGTGGQASSAVTK